ncbi:MAG: AMP-binding protein [Pseudomonadota bacterium]
MRLAERISTPGTVVETGTIRLTRSELSVGVLPEITNGVALSILDPATLIRLLAAFDGRVRAMLLLSPALKAEDVAGLMAEAGFAHLVSDRPELDSIAPKDAFGPETPVQQTDWLLTTSGTTGRPKIVRHRLATLLRSTKPASGAVPVWGLLYEPTRFAGLQVVLQALAGGGRLIAPRYDAPMPQRLALLAGHSVTHLSATPTLWRRILMEPASETLSPTHITLGGEIADGPVLAALAARWPNARIRHIYASTELGVGFSVRDGRPGFPSHWDGSTVDGVAIRVRDGELWLRPESFEPDCPLTPDAEGFYPTGDRVLLEEDRVLFLGRDSSTVNIGGTKIQPEAVERVLHEHPDVAIARIGHRPSPIAGALLTLTVVPRDPDADTKTLRRAISAFCRERLPREAMPAQITVIAEPEMNAAGKLTRGAA